MASTPTRVDPPTMKYDADRQVSRVLCDGQWTDSWLAPNLTGTKKADLETGEDTKGQ